MAFSTRRDTSKPGLAGITDDMWSALAAGRTTVGELADLAGVSPAAVSKFRRKRERAGSGGASAPPSTSPAPSGTSTPLDIIADPTALATSFAMHALLRAHDALAVGGLSPSATRAATMAGAIALVELRRLGVLTEGGDTGAPAELRITVMSDEEAAELKGRKVDLGEDQADGYEE
ncbi:hypothetical protein [Azospirillum lipoferum]|uniref:Uncharacterized protein n=1 Tax=Azospirillum lipoferum (strain 4B) TaxID=862719 RepID=G7Z354_AZOL4|nr:hypothetical protein [Azospirillum lipoferum]CBS85808.1 protein of unknown function [Azospirillum lipoferum 4B]